MAFLLRLLKHNRINGPVERPEVDRAQLVHKAWPLELDPAVPPDSFARAVRSFVPQGIRMWKWSSLVAPSGDARPGKRSCEQTLRSHASCAILQDVLSFPGLPSRVCKEVG